MTHLNKLNLAILILFVFLLNVSAQKESSVIKKLSKSADVILTGKVIHNESKWNAAKTKIYTKTTLHIDEYIKGNDSDPSIEITWLGGEVGGIGELYSHMPKFIENEEVLLFLKKDKMNRYGVLNGQEGKLNIIRDEKTNEKKTNSNIPIKSLKYQIKKFVIEK